MKKKVEMWIEQTKESHHEKKDKDELNSHDDNVLVRTKRWIVVLFCMLCTCSLNVCGKKNM
jgi:hypothetical protein